MTKTSFLPSPGSTPYVLVAALALAAAACGRPGPVETGPATASSSPETTAPAGLSLTERCTNPEAGYAISYPRGWHTDPGDVLGPCRVFHPEPFELEAGTEIPFDLSVVVDVDDVPYAEIRDTIRDGDRGLRVRSRTETRVAGRPAIRVHGVGTGAALLPEGMDRYGYVVDLDERTLLATTYGAGDLSFATKQDVLDAMVRTLELVAQAPSDGEALRPRASVTPPTTNADTRNAT